MRTIYNWIKDYVDVKAEFEKQTVNSINRFW